MGEDCNRLSKRSIERSTDIVGVHKTGVPEWGKAIKITDFPQVKADNSKLITLVTDVLDCDAGERDDLRDRMISRPTFLPFKIEVVCTERR